MTRIVSPVKGKAKKVEEAPDSEDVFLEDYVTR
jgi:hypothetical protein